MCTAAEFNDCKAKAKAKGVSDPDAYCAQMFRNSVQKSLRDAVDR